MRTHTNGLIHLTWKQKRLIEKMLYGPYEPQWYRDNGLVGNTDAEIAKRMDLPIGQVQAHTTKLSNERLKEVITHNGSGL